MLGWNPNHSLEGSGAFLYNPLQQFLACRRNSGCNLLNIVLIHLKRVERGKENRRDGSSFRPKVLVIVTDIRPKRSLNDSLKDWTFRAKAVVRVLSDKMSKPGNVLVYRAGTSTGPVLDVSDKSEGKYRIQFNIPIIIKGWPWYASFIHCKILTDKELHT